MHVDAAVARLAARQHSMVLRAQAIELGMTDRMIYHRVASSVWVRVAPGLYRLAAVPVTWKQRALAACLVAGPEAVVSHRSAAVLWGHLRLPARQAGDHGAGRAERAQRLGPGPPEGRRARGSPARRHPGDAGRPHGRRSGGRRRR